MLDQRVPLSDIRLLIVEDEPLIALLVEDFSVELGCQTFKTARTVPQALQLLQSFHP